MDEYIEREAAINSMCRLCSDTTRDKCRIADICNHVWRLEAIPAADVRPVVLCRDCMLRQYCKVAQYLGGDGFCSNGEKREESR